MSDNGYKLIDSGDFKRLEQVGPYTIIRPSLAAVWPIGAQKKLWSHAHAEFFRDSSGNGSWEGKKLPESWEVNWNSLKLKVKPTSFGHLGLFPEHQQLWTKIQDLIEQSNTVDDFQFLNLFAYTGGASLAAAAKGAAVTHVDGSKASVNWARENAECSGLTNAPIRWLTDDVQVFIKREVRRERKYHGVLLDPPSYGRGPKNQMWKIEEHLSLLLSDISKLLHPDFHFVILSAHSPGYTPLGLENLLKSTLSKKGFFESAELVVTDKSDQPLPSGSYSLYLKQ